MSTTGTTNFNLQLNELVEEAFERAGAELRTGYELRTARRSLNLLTIEWANRGINLWTVEQGQIPMVQGQITYPLPIDTIDLMDMVIRTQTGINQSDININRISSSTYATIPNKNAQGRPIQVWINRQTGYSYLSNVTLNGNITASATTIILSSTADLANVGFIQIGSEIIGYSGVSTTAPLNQLQNCVRGVNGTTAAAHTSGAAVTVQNFPSVNVWPAPDQGSATAPYYTFVYWRLRRMQDAGNGTATEDIPFRMLPCLVAGLAYYIAMKIPEGAPRLEMLKASYEEQWLIGSSEDREKASLRLAPRQYFY
jgi:hypothetical protein